MAIVDGRATLERASRPGHQFDALLIVVHEMQEADLASRELLDQFETLPEKFLLRQHSAQFADFEQGFLAFDEALPLCHLHGNATQQMST